MGVWCIGAAESMGVGSMSYILLGAVLDLPTLPLTEPVLIVATVMFLVLVLPLLGRVLRIPDIILLILAGMVFGENGLGFLELGQAIEVWGTVGLLYIMFLAGLDINVTDFLRHRNKSVVVGGLSFLVPQLVGTLLAVWLLGFGWIQAILLASMLASFTLLTYPQISRLGLTRRESVSVTVGSVLITDTLALIVLALMVELYGQEAFSLWFLLRMALAFGVFLVIVLWGVPRIGRWFFHHVARDGGAQFLFVLVVAFLAGSLSRLAGVEPIIGAFLAGTTLNRLVPPQSALMNRIEFMGRNLFIPFFLISVGMIVDPRVFLADRTTWLVGGFMVIAVFVTKYVASIGAQWILGYSRDEGWMIFGLTVTQAAATLAAVIVGYEIGIFDDAVLNGTLMMILATCMVSPWITEYFGRRVALQSPEHESAGEETGRILVAVGNPERAERLVDLALLLRGRDSHEPLLPLRVAITESEATSDVAHNEKMLLEVIAQAVAADVPVSPLVRVASGVADGIRRASIELRSSTVLLGAVSGHVMGSAFLGGVLEDVLRICPARIIVCQLALPLNTAKQILVAIPPNAEHEVGFHDTMLLVWRMAGQTGATLSVLAADANREAIQAITSAFDFSVEASWPAAGAWADVRRELLGRREEDVLRVVITAREGGLSWRPGMDKLPRMLPGTARDVGNLMLYPPLPSHGQVVDLDAGVPDMPNAVEVPGALQAEQGITLEQALPRLLACRLHEKDLTEAVGLLRRSAQEFPIELAPGVVLVHAHTDAVPGPQLYALHHPDGVQLAEVEAHVVLVLLGPESGPPDRHLRVLSALARYARNGAAMEALCAAPDSEVLTERLRSDMVALLSTEAWS